jgi:hypothetical protein
MEINASEMHDKEYAIRYGSCRKFQYQSRNNCKQG